MRRALFLCFVASAAISCGEEPTQPDLAPAGNLARNAAAPASTSSQLATSSTTYTVIFLGFLGGGSNSDAQDGNSIGVIVGEGVTSSGANHAFRWSETAGFQDLGTLPGGNYSNAIAINEAGVIAGDANVSPGGPDRAMRWTEAGGMQDLGLLPGGTHSRAIDVNELGHIVGFADVGGIDHPFLWTEAGGMVDLGTMSPGRRSRALDINNNGQAVGHGLVDAQSDHGFIWTQAGGFQDLGLLPGWTDSRAFDVNDAGVVVGYASLPGNEIWRAFKWTAAGGLAELPHLPNGRSSKAVDINEAGEITGWDHVGGDFRAVLWPPSGGVVDLGVLLGTTFSKGYGITGTGVIVGESTNRATIWTPSSSGGGGTSSIAVNAGNNQSTVVGTAVTTPPSVKVTDADGNPLPGVAVDFAVVAGGGSVTGALQTTDAAGMATVASWTAGTTAGSGNNRLTATSTGLSGSPVTFTASATPGPVNAATATATVPNGAVGSPTAISIRAKDQHGNNLTTGGATVVVTVTGANSATPAVTDNGNGTYTAGYTPTVPGADQVAVALSGTAIGGSPYPSTVSTGGSTRSIAIKGGNNQTATVGTTVTTRPSLKATDAAGNPVAGVVVSFAVATGGGTITGPSQTTGSGGIATVGSWRLGTAAGTNTLTASASGVTGSPVTFSAVANPGPAAAPASTAAVPDGTVGEPTTIVVQAKDQYGNSLAVGGATVAVAVGGANSATPAVTYNGNGSYTASYTPVAAGTDQVAITLNATVIGGSPYPSTVSGGASAAPTIALDAGDNQVATVGTPVATPPSVRLTDAAGAPVAGVAVTFAAAAGGGTIAGASQTTDATGIATAGSWILGTTAGTNRLTATSSGVMGSPVTFAATGTAGPAFAAASLAAVPSGTAGSPTTIGVQSKDQHGNSLTTGGATVVVTVTGTNLATPGVTDNGNGTYTAAYTPAATGTDQIGITLDGSAINGSPFTSAVSGGGTASTIALNAGNSQTAAVATAVTTRPSVRVTDAGGNPVAGIAVTFAVIAGGGTLTGASQATDGNGIAAVGSWTLGTKVGTNRIRATSPGLTGSPVTFTATATAGPAARIVISKGNNQTAPAGTTVPTRPAVKVTDAYGNGVPNVVVSWSVTSGGGSITFGTAAGKTGSGGTDMLGSWRLGPAPGPNTLTATAGSAGVTDNPVTFTATGT